MNIYNVFKRFIKSIFLKKKKDSSKFDSPIPLISLIFLKRSDFTLAYVIPNATIGQETRWLKPQVLFERF